MYRLIASLVLVVALIHTSSAPAQDLSLVPPQIEEESVVEKTLVDQVSDDEVTDSVDFDADDIAAVEEYRRFAYESNATGRTGKQNGARQQGHARRQTRDQISYTEDHVGRVGVLHDLAVQNRSQL